MYQSMGSYIERALALHKEGCNCAQAVLCAYSAQFNLDERMAFRISEGFGGGIGGSHDGICGAAAAIYMLAGLKNSSGAVADGLTKKDTYALIRFLSKAFAEENGSNICRELLELNGQHKLTCADRVASAGRIVERFLLDAPA